MAAPSDSESTTQLALSQVAILQQGTARPGVILIALRHFRCLAWPPFAATEAAAGHRDWVHFRSPHRRRRRHPSSSAATAVEEEEEEEATGGPSSGGQRHSGGRLGGARRVGVGASDAVAGSGSAAGLSCSAVHGLMDCCLIH
jgi:hypothetical protein